MFTSYFESLFSSSDPSRIFEAVAVVQGHISDAMREILDAEFTRDEIFHTVKNMKPTVAPRPDGMTALFFQNFWNIVGGDVSDIALDILNHGGNPSTLNHTYIRLIPKKKNPHGS